MTPETYTIKPFPPSRRFFVDGMDFGGRKHCIHGLIEVDITEQRQRLAEVKQRTGQSLSFTGFIVYCCAQVVDHNKHVHAYRDWRHRVIYARPQLLKRYAGTVMVTSVGMFGTGGGWGIGPSGHTLVVTVGGIVARPCLVNGRLENREHLCLTVTFDHAVVDGAPAARFIQQFKELIEDAGGLPEEQAMGT